MSGSRGMQSPFNNPPARRYVSPDTIAAIRNAGAIARRASNPSQGQAAQCRMQNTRNAIPNAREGVVDSIRGREAGNELPRAPGLPKRNMDRTRRGRRKMTPDGIRAAPGVSTRVMPGKDGRIPEQPISGKAFMPAAVNEPGRGSRPSQVATVETPAFRPGFRLSRRP
ncbi:MAG: hypothetical protein LBI87_07965, partial [Candidatus Accumulibacter sp.]|nr:hypothetical protein [Accumulibacter sp.]